MFRGGDGNLYKEAWPSLTGASDSEYEEYMMERLRTNSGKDSWDGEGANCTDVSLAVELCAAPRTVDVPGIVLGALFFAAGMGMLAVGTRGVLC